MNQIKLQMDFEIPEDLIGVYQRSSTDLFIGYDAPLSMTEAKKALERYQRTKLFGGVERLCIMKIYKGETLIGFSLPRIVKESEYKGMKIESGTDWYRLGTIFIDKPYRGKGVITEVVKLFQEIYPNICWQCEIANKVSFNSAIKAGFKFSHYLWFNNEGSQWSFEEQLDKPHQYCVLKIGR